MAALVVTMLKSVNGLYFACDAVISEPVLPFAERGKLILKSLLICIPGRALHYICHACSRERRLPIGSVFWPCWKSVAGPLIAVGIAAEVITSVKIGLCMAESNFFLPLSVVMANQAVGRSGIPKYEQTFPWSWVARLSKFYLGSHFTTFDLVQWARNEGLLLRSPRFVNFFIRTLVLLLLPSDMGSTTFLQYDDHAEPVWRKYTLRSGFHRFKLIKRRELRPYLTIGLRSRIQSPMVNIYFSSSEMYAAHYYKVRDP